MTDKNENKNGGKKLPEQPSKQRVVVTFDLAEDMNLTLDALQKKGFECQEKLESIGCAVGLTSEDLKTLKAITGVKAVEPEQTMNSQNQGA